MVALLVWSCSLGCTGSDERQGTGESPDDPGADVTTLPPEDRDISVVMWPVYDFDAVLEATEDALPRSLSGVKVCVKKVRPWKGTWEDFLDVDGPCTTTETDELIELAGVPPNAELVITAEKEGYWPAAIPLVTGAWSIDVTTTAAPNAVARLISKGSAFPSVGPGPSEDAGFVLSMVIGGSALSIGFLGGVEVTLSPGPSEGPFYSTGVEFDETATMTFPGDHILDINATELTWSYVRPKPFALFADVPEGDHVLRFDTPLAVCEVAGRLSVETYGYPGGLGEVRVPVLAGHTMTNLVASCQCHETSPYNVESSLCQPPSDGGVP